MRTISSGAKGSRLLLVLAFLSNACVSLHPPHAPGRSLLYTPHDTMGPVVPPLETTARRHHHRSTREVGPGSTHTAVSRNDLAVHLAFRKGLSEVSGTTRRISQELFRLKSSHPGIAGAGSGIFVRYVNHGEAQLQWIDSALAVATELTVEAAEVEDADVRLALLRLAGPRLEAALMGSMLLAV